MLSTEANEQLKKLADEVSQREGCYLYDIQFKGSGKGRILSVFIDSDKEPVSIDQCADVSRGLSLLLDVNDLIPGGEYELEVSSPGLERILREEWHFKKACGEKIRVLTKNAVLPNNDKGTKKSNIKQVIGELKSLKEDLTLEIEDGDKFWEVKMDNVHKANVVFDFSKEFNTKKKKAKR